jgi:hypothetical protein
VKCRHQFSVILVFCILLPAIGFEDLQAQTVDPRLAKVFADWEKRQQGIIRVRYSVAGEVVLPKGSFNNDPDLNHRGKGDFPADDLRSQSKFTLLLDFEKNRFRIESSGKVMHLGKGQLIPRVTTHVFDGASFKAAIPRLQNSDAVFKPAPLDPDVAVATGVLDHLTMESNYWPLFLGHGIVPTVHTPLKDNQLRFSPEAKYWNIFGEGVHKGQRCLVLRTKVFPGPSPHFDEYWVDVSRGSAVVKQVSFSNGKPLFDWDIQYQRTALGWLPRNWTWASYLRGKAHSLETMHLQDFSFDPVISDQDFDIAIEPGMIVVKADYTGNQEHDNAPAAVKKYRISDNGDWNEIVRGVEQKPAASPRTWWLISSLAALAMISGLLILAWRSKRRPKSLGGIG